MRRILVAIFCCIALLSTWCIPKTARAATPEPRYTLLLVNDTYERIVDKKVNVGQLHFVVVQGSSYEAKGQTVTIIDPPEKTPAPAASLIGLPTVANAQQANGKLSISLKEWRTAVIIDHGSPGAGQEPTITVYNIVRGECRLRFKSHCTEANCSDIIMTIKSLAPSESQKLAIIEKPLLPKQ